jgi:hypothetical protein
MKRASTSFLLDNEAVQALSSRAHPKHQRALELIGLRQQRGRSDPRTGVVHVSTAVRVEAGWDRTDPTAAHTNGLLRARDVDLDADAADLAVRIRARCNVSVVDASLGAAIAALPDPVVVITSDPHDVRAMATAIGRSVNIVTL